MNEFIFWFIWLGDVAWVIFLTVFLLIYGLVIFVILPFAVLFDHIMFRYRIKEVVALGIPREVILKEYNHKFWDKLKKSYKDSWDNYKKIFVLE